MRTRTVIATVVVVVLALGACGGDEEPLVAQEPPATTQGPGEQVGPVEPDPSPEPSPPGDDGSQAAEPSGQPGSGEGETATAGPNPDVAATPDTLQGAAEAYIEARENQASFQHRRPSDWLDDVQPVMSQDGFEVLLDQAVQGGNAGAAWNIAHDKQYAVRTQVGECVVNMASGVDAEDNKIIQCAVNDVVVDQDGQDVPTTQIDPQFPFVGPQPAALLEMVLVDGNWVVAEDLTGTAS